MDAFLYPIITVLYLTLFIWSFRFFRESSFWGTSWVLFIIVAFIYDNFILSVGNWIGVGETLEVLSLFRYLLHVLLIPTLVFVSLDILRRINVDWSEYLSVQIIYNLYTFTLTVIGVFTDILWIHLEPVQQNGVIRYIASESHLPYSSILTLIPLLISAIMVWRRLRWPILLMGIFLMVGGGMVAIVANSQVIGAAFELILMWSLVMTEQKLNHEDFHTPPSMIQ